MGLSDTILEAVTQSAGHPRHNSSRTYRRWFATPEMQKNTVPILSDLLWIPPEVFDEAEKTGKFPEKYASTKHWKAAKARIMGDRIVAAALSQPPEKPDKYVLAALQWLASLPEEEAVNVASKLHRDDIASLSQVLFSAMKRAADRRPGRPRKDRPA